MRNPPGTGRSVLEPRLEDAGASISFTDAAIAELGREWDIGIASGPSRDGERAFARILSRFTAENGGRFA
ncbi:hypothetical protein STHU_11670 [Allostella humosa]|nr:hypothetical protein STHU_11670 [Stella humosa]